MRDKFRILYRPFDGRWRFVDGDGEVYHAEHFAHGNDYRTYASYNVAKTSIRVILSSEKAIIKKQAERRWRKCA